MCVCVCVFLLCGPVRFFCCLGGGSVLFVVWAGGVLFLLFGRWRVHVFPFWAGKREFTDLPACLPGL